MTESSVPITIGPANASSVMITMTFTIGWRRGPSPSSCSTREACHENGVDVPLTMRTIERPMAYTHTIERALRGTAPSSAGARQCQGEPRCFDGLVADSNR